MNLSLNSLALGQLSCGGNNITTAKIKQINQATFLGCYCAEKWKSFFFFFRCLIETWCFCGKLDFGAIHDFFYLEQSPSARWREAGKHDAATTMFVQCSLDYKLLVLKTMLKIPTLVSSDHIMFNHMIYIFLRKGFNTCWLEKLFRNS